MDQTRHRQERSERRAVVETELARLSTEPARAASWAVVAGELRALERIADPADEPAIRLLTAMSRLVEALRASGRPVGQAALGLVGEGLHDLDQMSGAGSACAQSDDELTGAMELLMADLAQAPDGDSSFNAQLEAFVRGGRQPKSRRRAASLAAEGAMRLESVWSGLADYVRRQGEALGKRVELVSTGGEIEVSGRAGEALRPALMQLIRNACAHGVETPAARQGAGKPGLAILRLSARRSGDRVEVTLADDGRGMDAARRLAEAGGIDISRPADGGFRAVDAGSLLAAADGLRAEVGSPAAPSERGGLDLVRGGVEEAGGRMALRSTPGRGAAFTLSLPGPGMAQPGASHRRAEPRLSARA